MTFVGSILLAASKSQIAHFRAPIQPPRRITVLIGDANAIVLLRHAEWREANIRLHLCLLYINPLILMELSQTSDLLSMRDGALTPHRHQHPPFPVALKSPPVPPSGSSLHLTSLSFIPSPPILLAQHFFPLLFFSPPRQTWNIPDAWREWGGGAPLSTPGVRMAARTQVAASEQTGIITLFHASRRRSAGTEPPRPSRIHIQMGAST